MNNLHIPLLPLLLLSCLVATSRAGIVLSDAERIVCLRNVVKELAKVPIPSQVREVAEKAHDYSLNGYFLNDIGGSATAFILEASKIAFMDILRQDQYLGSCRQFHQQIGKFVYGYECAGRTRYQDMMNQRILGQRNLMNEYTRLSNACLFLILANQQAAQ